MSSEMSIADQKTASVSTESCMMNENTDRSKMNVSTSFANGVASNRLKSLIVSIDLEAGKASVQATASKSTDLDANKATGHTNENSKLADRKSPERETKDGKIETLPVEATPNEVPPMSKAGEFMENNRSLIDKQPDDDEMGEVQAAGGQFKRIKVIQDEADRVDLTESRQNSKHPDEYVESFEELNLSQQLLQNLQSVYIEKPNDLQSRMLPVLLKNRAPNIYFKTKPHSGKKTAFLINTIQRIDPDLQATQAIILAATAELVYYIAEQAEKLTQNMNIRIYKVTGQDEERDVHLQQEERTEHLVVTTIGTCLFMQGQKVINYNRLRCVVLDELDLLMSNFKNDRDLRRVLDRIGGTSAQFALFSTSFCDSSLYEVKKQLGVRKIVIRNILNRSFPSAFLQFYVNTTSMQSKQTKLVKILQNVIKTKIVIYLLGVTSTEHLAGHLESCGFKTILVTRRTALQERMDAYRRFNSSKVQTILCTNYPNSHGIPLDDVNVVINFDLPKKLDYLPIEYLHRIAKCNTANDKPAFIVNMIHRESKPRLQRLSDYYGKCRMIELDV